MQKKITLGHNTFILNSYKTLFWQERELLMIADAHLGKVAHFRKYGSAVPLNAVTANFTRLSQAVDFYKPKTVCFLGDLFHSTLNNEWQLFENWIRSRDERFILVIGNHDVISPLKFKQLDIKVVSEMVLDTFLLTHHPEERDTYFNFSGHIHPGIRIGGLGKQLLKLSCFYKRKNQLILPAFGTFTGNYYISPEEGDEVYAITQEEVIQIQ